MNYAPAIGDLLVRQKALGIFDHVGVLVAYNTVLQNTPEKGEHLASIEEFAAGESIVVHPTRADEARVLSRARKVLANAKSYNPLSRNCEHTATEVLHGIARSPQLLFYGALIVIGLILLFLLARR